jgi:hypothetical protein
LLKLDYAFDVAPDPLRVDFHIDDPVFDCSLLIEKLKLASVNFLSDFLFLIFESEPRLGFHLGDFFLFLLDSSLPHFDLHLFLLHYPSFFHELPLFLFNLLLPSSDLILVLSLELIYKVSD